MTVTLSQDQVRDTVKVTLADLGLLTQKMIEMDQN